MSHANRRRVALTVSGTIPLDLQAAVDQGRRPRVDYLELAVAADADLVDHAEAVRRTGRLGATLARYAGPNAALAFWCFRARRQYDVIVTDGEQIGLPFAALARLGRRRGRARHLMIGHILSVPKKVRLYRALRLGSRIDEMLLYSTAQRRFVVEHLGYPADRVTMSNFMVDTQFFAPAPTVEEMGRTVCAAGLEFRDYPTLIDAVRDLDCTVTIAAASPWSKRPPVLGSGELPANVSLVSLDLFELRKLYGESSVVVMPLVQNDFQAGVTTLLEAMAMARPIVCSRTEGQVDVIEDGRTGRYVSVGDAAGLRHQLEQLLAEPEARRALGEAARAWVVAHADIDVYVEAIAARVAELRQGRDVRSF